MRLKAFIILNISFIIIYLINLNKNRALIKALIFEYLYLIFYLAFSTSVRKF